MATNTHRGHTGMAFIAGYFNGSRDPNASPGEIGSYVAGAQFKTETDQD